MNTKIAIAALALASAGALAGEIHTSEASLLGVMAGGFAFNDFNTVSDGATPSLSYTMGAFSYDITTGAVPSSGLYNQGGVISTESNFDSLIISFTSGNVHAIGANVWASDPGFDPAGAVMIIGLSDGTVEFFPSGGPDAFYGYTSDTAITSVVIRAVGLGRRYATMDNLFVGTTNNLIVVPLPSAAWAGLGMLGLAGGLRTVTRRR